MRRNAGRRWTCGQISPKSSAQRCWCAGRRARSYAPRSPRGWSTLSRTVSLWRSTARVIRSAWTIQPILTAPFASSCVVQSGKDLVRRLVRDVFNGERPQTADEVLAPTFVNHNAMPGTPPGPEGTKRANVAIRAAFPDWSESIEDLIAEGDRVALYAVGRGMQQGEFMVNWPEVAHLATVHDIAARSLPRLRKRHAATG